jgi:hypothetical protein
MARNRRAQPNRRSLPDAKTALTPGSTLPTYDAPPLDSAVSDAELIRGREFVRLFNEIDHYIKRLVGSNGGEGFFRRLQWAVRDNPALKRYHDDLLEYAELRNAIVHERHFPNRMIAVPTESVLADFRRLVERIVRPRRVLPQFACALRVFAPDEPLSAVLEYMHQTSYTQVVAREGGELRLVTASAVTRWLAAHITAPPVSDGSGGSLLPASSIDLTDALVADVLRLEKPEALLLISSQMTLEEAVDTFQSAISKRRGRLYALVITENGLPHEEPLGIITPVDLLDED